MNEKKDKLQLIKEKAKLAKNVATNPEVKKAMKDVWQSLKDVADTFDINK